MAFPRARSKASETLQTTAWLLPRIAGQGYARVNALRTGRLTAPQGPCAVGAESGHVGLAEHASTSTHNAWSLRCVWSWFGSSAGVVLATWMFCCRFVVLKFIVVVIVFAAFSVPIGQSFVSSPGWGCFAFVIADDRM